MEQLYNKRRGRCMWMIDLRSDTVTKPTEAMRKAMYEAEVGDDVYIEDPTIIQLENLAAEIVGKEAALFVPSGTQGNQIAVLSFCRAGEEIIVEADSHIFYYEGGAISAFAGVQPRTLVGERGSLKAEDVTAAIRVEDVHFPETGLICLENTHNWSGGAVIPVEDMQAVYEVVQQHNIPVHLDGARIFNASIASGVSVKEFAKYTDSIQFCLSKGLGAPIGSVIAGDSDFINRARKWRKRLGGGLRQAGILAAPGIVALETMVDRLAEDHDHAKRLAEGLGNISSLTVENIVETNIVVINVKSLHKTAVEFVELLKDYGILANAYGTYNVRLVTHYDVSPKDIETTIEKVQSLVKALKLITDFDISCLRSIEMFCFYVAR